MPSASPTYWTAELVRALPDDGQRHEVVHGELLVTPAPRLGHQEILKRLVLALDPYIQAEAIGALYFSPADISPAPDTLLQPDLFVVPRTDPMPREWAEISALVLAVEILSPSTARHDRFQKRRQYQEMGVPHYWIVDPDARVVELWRPGDRFPAIERERLAWQPAAAKQAFSLDLAALFGQP